MWTMEFHAGQLSFDWICNSLLVVGQCQILTEGLHMVHTDKSLLGSISLWIIIESGEFYIDIDISYLVQLIHCTNDQSPKQINFEFE